MPCRGDLRACLTDRAVNATVYVVGLSCQPLIGWDLIDDPGLSIHGRGCLSGLGTARHTACEHSHQVQPQPHRDGADSQSHDESSGIGKTSSGCISVPKPCFKQSVHEARTECVDEQTHMHPTVDQGTSTRITIHIHASARCKVKPQVNLNKLLFLSIHGKAKPLEKIVLVQ